MPSRELLIDSNPDLYKELALESNSDIDCRTLFRTDTRKVWWHCKSDPRHIWQASVRNRSVNGSGCLYCAGKLVLREESLGVVHPQLLEEWDYEKNKHLDPYAVSCQSNKPVHWICKNDPSHKWKSDANHRAKLGHGCKKCADKSRGRRGPKKYLLRDFPHIAREWDHDRNEEVRLSEVTHGSSYKAWWVCGSDNEHRWQSTVINRTSKHRGCPICSGEVPSAKNSLASNYPAVAKEWHYEKNAPLFPNEVTRASGKKFWWQCSANPDYEWEAVVRNRTTLGSKCPHCDNEIKLLRLWGYLLESEGGLSDQYKTFAKSLFSVEAIIKEANFSKEIYDKALLKLAFASVITSMETYLSDLFLELVLVSEERIDKLFINSTDYNAKKYSIAEAIRFAEKKEVEAERYLQNIIWHNLPKVGHLYKNVLGINFDQELTTKVNELIGVRHDIVHRNGRRKNGGVRRITRPSVQECVDKVKYFVEKVETAKKSI